MEPVNPSSDFLTTRGTLRKCVTLAVYTATSDEGSANPWAAAVSIQGSRGTKRTVAGMIPTTVTTWHITAQTPDQTLARPALLSKIVNGSDTWQILEITAAPRNGKIFECQTQLIPGG